MIESDPILEDIEAALQEYKESLWFSKLNDLYNKNVYPELFTVIWK
jgi:hypothetical protein